MRFSHLLAAASVVVTDRGRLHRLEHSAPAATTTPSHTQPVSKALAPYYDQEVDWSDCDDFECATIKVPLDYSQPGEESISLSVIRRPADDREHRVGQLLVNPGGPGVSGIGFARQRGVLLAIPPILEKYDIVGWDPRGVGHEHRCRMPHRRANRRVPVSGSTPDTPAEVAQLLAMQRGFTRACEANMRPICCLTSGPMDSARDMDILRAALGEG